MVYEAHPKGRTGSNPVAPPVCLFSSEKSAQSNDLRGPPVDLENRRHYVQGAVGSRLKGPCPVRPGRHLVVEVSEQLVDCALGSDDPIDEESDGSDSNGRNDSNHDFGCSSHGVNMDFDLDGPDNLTSDQKLFNIKAKVNEINRFVDEISHSLVTPIEVVRFAHVIRAAMVEIEKEIDRTV